MLRADGADAHTCLLLLLFSCSFSVTSLPSTASFRAALTVAHCCFHFLHYRFMESIGLKRSRSGGAPVQTDEQRRGRVQPRKDREAEAATAAATVTPSDRVPDTPVMAVNCSWQAAVLRMRPISGSLNVRGETTSVTLPAAYASRIRRHVSSIECSSPSFS